MLYKDKSDIEGNGLFSTVDIKKGEYIGSFGLEDAVYTTKFSIWVDDKQYKATGMVKYANHSSTPNAEVKFPEMYALKNIKAGEEILWDYGDEFEL
jgi:SET domain-containing protein